MEDKYKKSKGNAGLDGVQFQLNLLTVFLLNALHGVKNWKISTENQEAGKYDDLVMELPDKNILLQAKFKLNKKINKDQLFSCNTKNADFSLPKYFFSYLEIKSASIQKTVIICTNTDIEEKGLQKFLIRHRVDADSMLYYEGATCPFFTVNDNVLADLKSSAESYLEKNLQGKGFDKAVITDENIKDFLKNLQIFSNYPSGDKLDKVIGQLLSSLNNSGLYRKVSSQEIYKKIENWFKQPKGEYLTEARAKAIFSEIRSDKFCEELHNYGVSFRLNDLNFTDPKRIFIVSSEGGYLLQALKIYDALRKDERKQLYVNPNDEIEVQKDVIEAFRLSRYKFLIIIATKITQEITKEISSKLKDMLKKYSYKKVILVAEPRDELSLRQISDDIFHIDGSVTFDDLSDGCQMRLVQEKNIIFQEDEISLEQLLAPQTSEDWAKAINSEILEKLIRKNKIKVGVFPTDSEESNFRYYVHRTFKREVDKGDVEIGSNELKGKTLLGAMVTLNLKEKKKEEFVEEESIYDVKEDVVLIADSAGMGKSTVLTKLAMTIKEKNPHLWVIKIELTEYTDMLRTLLKNKEDSLTAIKLLNSKKATKLTNNLERFVFSMNKKVVLMLDGIDEISPDYTKLVLNLLTQCQQAGNFKKLFVTTRPHMTEELEGILRVKPFILQPFTQQNQVDFLTSYWAYSLSVYHENKEKCAQYAKELISRMSSWTEMYDYDFPAIPLQLRMLAEIFQESIKWNKSAVWEGCKEYLMANRVLPKLPERMEVKELYDMFVEKKRDLYVYKGNPSGNAAANEALTEQFNKSLTYHKKIALEMILHEEDCLLLSSYQQNLKDINQSILKIGIIQKTNNELNFIHRTFTEYFVAGCLINELQLQLCSPNVKFQEFFIDKILQSSEYKVIRIFLDSFLMKIYYCVPPNIFDYYYFNVCHNYHSENEHSLIHLVASEGCVAILQLVLKCVNFKIIKDKEIDIIDFSNNIFGNQTDTENKNVLKTIQVIVRAGGINIKDEIGCTPLSRSAQRGHFEMVRFLVKLGASIDSVNNEGITALHFPAFIGRVDIIQFLVKCGSNVNIQSKEGCTALYYALMGNHLDVIEYLLKSGSDVNVKDKDSWTALHFAVRFSELDIVNLILELGADIYAADIQDYTALHYAVADGKLAIVKLLLEHMDGDFTCKNNKGLTTLHIASEYGRLDMVKFLFELGIDINVGDINGCTALHRACANGQLATVKLLEQLGGDLTVRDNWGDTILLFAAGKGHLDIVKFLLELGIDVNIGNADGITALHWAAMNGQLETIKFLLEAGADFKIENDIGRTALSFAIVKGDLRVTEYLVKFDDVNIKDSMGRTALHLASEIGQLDVVKFLLGLDVDFNVRNNDGRTELHLAAGNGHLDTVKFLFELGIDVNIRDTNGYTALHLASGNGHLATVKCLVKLGGDCTARDNSGNTILHVAAMKGHLDIVKFLLEVGVDVNIGNTDGRTALLLAIADGRFDTVKFLIEQGVDINVVNTAGFTALHLAAGNGHLDIVKFLLDKGVDVNVGDTDGNTPLHLAAGNGHLDIVKFLVELSVNINSGNIDGNTTLHFAAAGGHLDVMEYVIALNGDINVKDNTGCTVLHFAVENGHLDIVKFLLQLGVDANVAKTSGRTALHLASGNGHLDIVKVLLEQGVDANVEDAEGHTPLHVAASDGHLDTVKFLFEQGVNINVKNTDGITALHLAAAKGQFATVKLLLGELGGDSTVKENNGFTALHFAAGLGHLDIVKFLLERGLDVNDEDTDACTAMRLAAGNGHLDTVKFFLELGVDANVADTEGYFALHLAAKGGHLAIVNLLLEQMGGDFNVRDNNGHTILHFAAAFGHLDVVQFLVDLNVDVNDLDSDGCTALILAAADGHLDVVKFLLEKGSDFKIEEKRGRTALHFAIGRGDLTVIECLLKSSGVNIKDSMGRTALHLASEGGQLDTVKFLLGLDVDFNVRKNDGRTELHLSTENGHLDIIKFYLELGVDVNVGDTNGYTPLHLAAANGHLDAVKLLLSSGADCGIKNSDGSTAQQLALNMGHSQIANLEWTEVTQK